MPRRLPGSLVWALVGLLAVNLLSAVLTLPTLPFFDEAVYGTRALGIRDALLRRDLESLYALLLSSRLHPPLAAVTALPLVTVVANAGVALRLTAWLWVALLSVGAFFLARRLGLPSRYGALSLMFVLASPLLLSIGWRFGTDVPLACLVILTLWLLLERPFASPWRSMGLGLLVGTGLLTKESFPLFVAVPVLLEFGRKFAAATRERTALRVALCGGVALGAAALVASLWYLPNLGWLAAWAPAAYRSEGSARIFGTGETLSMQEVALWTAKALFTEGVASWVTLLGAYGAVGLIRLPGPAVHRWGWALLAASAFPALAVWLTSTSKAVRYVLPVLVLVCVAAGLGAQRLWVKGTLGRAAVAAGVGLSAFLAPATYWADWVVPGFEPGKAAELVAQWTGVKVTPPWTYTGKTGDWHAVDLLRAIARDATSRGLENADVVVLSRYPLVSDNAYRFVVAWQKLPLAVGATSLRGWLPLAKQVRDSDYVVAKVGGSQGELNGKLDFARLWALLEEGFSHSKVASYPLPDGSELAAFRREARWYLGESGNAVYRIYEALGDAEILRRPEGAELSDVLRTMSDIDVGGEKRPGLFQHPPSTISFSLTLPRRSTIEFRAGVAIMPGAVGRSDGVRFRALVRQAGWEQVLIDRTVSEGPDASQLETVDLSQYSGNAIELVLETDPGPAGNPRYDWAVWISPGVFTSDR